MKLVLEIIAGPATGQCFAVSDDRVTTIGRTDAATFAIPQDNYLSRCHFAIRFHRETESWQIRDMESRHGTLVDGERIAETVLPDGSDFTAGQSVFRVRVATDEETTPEALATAAAAIALFTALAASERKPAKLPQYKKSKCHSGLISLVGEGKDPGPAEIAWLLANHKPLYLLADFAKAALPFPAQLQCREYLFNWADDDVLAEFSPIVIGPEDPVDPYEIIEGLWGRDALVCVFSSLDRGQLTTQLRAAVRLDDGLSRSIPKALAGCCWPESARSLLTSGPDRITAPLLRGEQLYLMEDEAQSSWQLFLPREQESSLRRILDP